MSQMTNKHKIGAWGLKGGFEGQVGATLYMRSGSEDWKTAVEAFGKVSPSKYSNIEMQPGDRVRVLAPGGGGFGIPTERSPQAVDDDIAEGFISVKEAEDKYGFSSG